MRKLIVGFLFGVALGHAAFADDFTRKAPDTSGLVLPPFNAKKPLTDVQTGPGTTTLDATAPARGDDRFTQQHIATEMKHLTTRLGLTPSEQVTVKASMESIVHGTGTQTVDQVLRKICDVKQLVAWEQIKSDARAEGAAQRSSLESHRIAVLFDLGVDEERELYNAIYPIELKGQTSIGSVHSAAEHFAFDSAQMRQKEAALGKFLTPAQLIAYRLDNEHRATAAEANLKASMNLTAARSYPVSNTTPQVNQPTFSLTGYVEP